MDYERMSNIHRYKRLVLTAAALLTVCAAALLAFAGPSPVNAALRSALPASWQKAQLGAARPANSPPMVLALKSPPQAKATPTAPPTQAVSSDSCIGCHTSEALLKQLVPAPAVAASSMLTGTQATAYTRTMPLWQQVLVDTAFLDDVHAKPGCIACHGGTPNTVDFADAHRGLRPQASAQPDKACGSCHVGVAKQGRSSLHHMQWGIQKALTVHGADLTNPVTAKAYAKKCTTCHASCSDCHVNRTKQAGGGLAAGHAFSAQGFDGNACTSCHGQTAGAESTGAHEGIQGDFHTALGMTCTSCHTSATTFHSGKPGVGMLDGRPEPACTDCHPQAAKPGGPILEHTIHSSTVQCQVCHAAGPYTSFDDYATLGKTGAVSETLAFKIGRNPLQSEQRPWNYVLLRQVPITAGTFETVGKDLLPLAGEGPAWMLATPHNMQRSTPQNQSCNACHGQETLFLTAKDVAPEAVEANRSVIVPKIPAKRLEVPQ